MENAERTAGEGRGAPDIGSGTDNKTGQGYRSGCHDRNFATTSGDIVRHMLRRNSAVFDSHHRSALRRESNASIDINFAVHKTKSAPITDK